MFSMDRVRRLLGFAPAAGNPDPDGLTIDEAWTVYDLAVGHEVEGDGASVTMVGRRDTGYAVLIRRPNWRDPLLIHNGARWENYRRRVSLERYQRQQREQREQQRAAQPPAPMQPRPGAAADSHLHTLATMSQPSHPSWPSQPSGVFSRPRIPVASVPVPTPGPQSQMLRPGGSDATDPGAMLRLAPTAGTTEPPTVLLPTIPPVADVDQDAKPAPPARKPRPTKATKPKTERAS